MSNVPDYRSPEQAHYETMRELRTALAQTERENEKLQHDIHQYVQIASDLVAERDEARGLYWKAVSVLRYMHSFPNASKAHEAAAKILPSDAEFDAHLRDTGE